MSIIKACLLLLVLLMCVGALNKCEDTTPPEYRRLFSVPKDRQLEEFKKYPLEQQLDIYIHAMRGVEPPATQFAGFLASNGKKAIPLLLQRLKEEKRDSFRYYLIRVFKEMHTEYCDLKDEQEIIETIKAVISEMKDLSYRGLCELHLKTILERPGASGSC